MAVIDATSSGAGDQAAGWCLDGLPRRVLELRRGLAGERPHTVEETARVILIHPDFVRAIEAAALEALRAREAGGRPGVGGRR